MKIKKLSVRMLVAVFLGLCAGIVMEFSSAWLVFPTFLMAGLFACIFLEIVIEFVLLGHKIKREDLRKIKKPALRILYAASIGLLAGIIIEFASIWAAFPFFMIMGVLGGITVGITIDLVRYNRSMRRAFLEGKDLGLERLPVSTADLIRQIIKKMRYRKEVRSEVMAELAEHFEDELKDCETDQDKEQKAKELIAEFGDAKLLAVLLRRAKIRCRPLWRTVVARTFQTAGALIFCFIVYAVWFSAGKPTISVDYLAMLNQLNKPEVHDEDNAWPHYEKAIALYVEPDKRIQDLTERRRKDFKKKLYFSDLNKNIQDMIRKWLQENESDWNSLELSQKQLFEKCFNEGLVPYIPYIDFLPAYMRGAYMRGYRSRRYCVFDKAVADSYRRIVWQQKSKRSERLPKYPDVRMMEMERISIYGFHPSNQRYIEMDPDIALDSEVITLFDSYSKDELKKIKDGINAGIISKWINTPLVAIENLCDYILPFEKKLIVKWIEDNEPAWREFLEGSSKSYCYREYQNDERSEDKLLWDIGSSHFSSVRRLTRLGVWRARIGLEQGHLQQRIDDCFAVAKAGSHWQGKGTIVEQLVGVAMGRLAYDEILHILAVQKFPADDLKRLQNQLSQLYPKGYPPLNMEGERVAFNDTIQRLFTKGGPGGGHLIPQKTEMLGDMYDVKDIAEDIPIGKKFFKNTALTSMCLLHARRDATIAVGNRIYKLAEEIAKMSPADRHERDIDSTDDVYLSMPKYRYILLDYLIPASERISELSYQGRTLHEATITILAIQRWRLDKGEYPAALNELIQAGYLKELPIDPYSDKPLIYKKIENNFTLYSIGRNFKDDGGKVIETDGYPLKWGSYEDADAVFWPVPKPWELE